ncbi:MAG TPA: ribosome maturation factor RimM [Silvibacterium sp.]|nr:ribosome maturation factor RimM [Silvibacterium sp.]
MKPEEQPAGPWTILARLIRPQGRRGEILADILTDFPERFATRRRLFLVSSETDRSSMRETHLENHWLHKDRVVLKFAGTDSITDADTLRGLFVAIPASERAPLSDGSLYIADLVGCEVVDIAGAPVKIGIVSDVDRAAGLLAVTTPDAGEVLIPFAKAFLVNVEIPGKRIEMHLPAGLLEINAPLTDEERRVLGSSDKS